MSRQFFDVGPTLHKSYTNVLCLLGTPWMNVKIVKVKTLRHNDHDIIYIYILHI